MNREIAETLRNELRRLASEGEEFLPLDDDCVVRLHEIAKRAALHSESADSAKQSIRRTPENSSETCAGYSGDCAGVKKVIIRKSAKSESHEAVEFEKFDEIKFEKNVNLVADIGAKNENFSQKKLKISQTQKDAASAATIPSPTPFSLPEGDKQTRWDALKNIVLADSVCNAHIKPTKKVVFGVGNLDAKIFFCGEAPGADEEIQGEPFVGRAGQLLTKIISAMGLSRSDVYIGNIMNWRPEVERGNRPPTEMEMAYCLPYLKAQLDIVNPQIVVALGMTAVQGLIGPDPTFRMGRMRGRWHKIDGRDLMITYHPSYLLQYASAATKRLVWEDMMAVMERVGLTVSDKQRGYFLPK